MYNLQETINEYLEFCQHQKQLNSKTLKAYRIDLKQFSDYVSSSWNTALQISTLENFISNLHDTYKPKTVKRKIASLKAFIHYLEFKDYIKNNPFNIISVKFREPHTLPKIIPLHSIETFMSTLYKQRDLSQSNFAQKCILRDIAVI